VKSYHREHSDATTKRWRPGEPIPRRGSGIEPNAYEALARNAKAFEHWQQEEQRRRVADRRAA
jgi:hypothetical protein